MYFETESLNTLVKELYSIEGCEAGGPLHIVLDDDNCCDDDILWCLKHACDSSYDDRVIKLCLMIGGILLLIKEENREDFIQDAFVRAHRK